VQLERERRTEYVNLLVATRELRYIALRTFQHRATRPIGEVDTLLTQLSAAYYRIALTAPENTRQLAWDLRESVFEVWRKARDHTDSGGYQDDMKKVRDLTAKFRSHVAAELNLAGVSREEDSELSQLPLLRYVTVDPEPHSLRTEPGWSRTDYPFWSGQGQNQLKRVRARNGGFARLYHAEGRCMWWRSRR
jgi:hypothetical protein